ncbi:nuclear transport factor 2 family protein [uncultured Aquimarina sp.]|uniref:nuclear transport factor 2 family protein n=1 Tax=uncultured Aquimarina sp. TaxID=575652 RepID=UPI00260B3A7C|nr:nuclear transport factor 2 family protein [uncultured Aquimarina sp.]
MKSYVFTFILVCIVQFSNAQSETSLIEKTLQNYIDGSSYNKIPQLKSAFAENATLYLTTKDGLFNRFTPDEYSGFFKNKTPGTFNGRLGKILEIAIVKDIATAKVEISFPEKGMLYIDLFLLKKENEAWKIISKTATRIDENK